MRQKVLALDATGRKNSASVKTIRIPAIHLMATSFALAFRYIPDVSAPVQMSSSVTQITSQV